jgi:uncharacterized protein
MLKKLYKNIILPNPKKILFLIFIITIILGYHATNLKIDASSNTLLLDNDKDLIFTKEISKKYSNDNILILTYTTNNNLLSNKTINDIDKLSKKIQNLNQIESITSILNVPLIKSPLVSVSELLTNIRTLKSKDTNRTLAKQELLSSPLYKENLVSLDFKTTALLLNIKKNDIQEKLKNKESILLTKRNNTLLNQIEENKLKDIQYKIIENRNIQKDINSKTIEDIRSIIKNHNTEAKIFLGGINMIVHDVVNYVKNDLLIYGSILVLLFIIILWVFFRKLSWVILPLLICLISVVCTTGILGILSWEVTVISSNFISIQLIITISLVIHLIVRYEELLKKYTSISKNKIILVTILSKIKPSFFAILTTVVGFLSLILSNIKPIINFGLMMSFGITISLLLSFIIFPSILMLLNKQSNNKKEIKTNNNSKIIHFCKKIIESRNKTILIFTIVISLFSIYGSSLLIVENSFINYFKKNTEIYQGMRLIDEKLGGTTPLDIIVTFNKKDEIKSIDIKDLNEDIQEDEFESFYDEFEINNNEDQYWFTNDKLNIIKQIDEYLQNIPQIGNVASFATILKIGKILNNDIELDSLKLALIYNSIPDKYRKLIINPYINIKDNQTRFILRIKDSSTDLRRNILITKLNNELKSIITPQIGEYRLSNIMILYNNMLQTLFKSQILTLGSVALILFLMFIILFRSFKIALISIIVNMIPISLIFGIMGIFNIPLDLMTITIAAISIGIGVDQTIHYIHRYKEEFSKDKNYLKAMSRSHDSIGYAMVYTSLVIIIGFSILVFSNFIPTIYFGLLTVVAMSMVLISALILLPKMIILFKAFNKKN